MTNVSQNNVALSNNVNEIDAIAAFKLSLLASVEARAEFEHNKSDENTSMQKTLSDIHKSVNNDAIARIMMLSNCDANRINKSERVNSRLNVYAYEKDVNLARFLDSAANALNHYTQAVFKSALALESAEMLLTHKDAISACSMNCKSDAKREALIKACKYQRHVAANTASTQSSSSISALQSFNVLTETRDAQNNVAYKLNRESFAFKILAERFASAN
jgi:hypothetical protein